MSKVLLEVYAYMCVIKLHCLCQVYGMLLIMWQFVIPLIVFVVAYWKILAVVRRQAKVAARLMGTSKEPVAGPSRGTVETTNAALSKNENQRDEVIVKAAMMAGPRERGQVGKQQGSMDLSKAQINVVRTMIYITVCFILCWMPMYTAVTLSKIVVLKQFNHFQCFGLPHI